MRLSKEAGGRGKENATPRAVAVKLPKHSSTTLRRRLSSLVGRNVGTDMVLRGKGRDPSDEQRLEIIELVRKMTPEERKAHWRQTSADSPSGWSGKVSMKLYKMAKQVCVCVCVCVCVYVLTSVQT